MGFRWSNINCRCARIFEGDIFWEKSWSEAGSGIWFSGFLRSLLFANEKTIMDKVMTTIIGKAMNSGGIVADGDEIIW